MKSTNVIFVFFLLCMIEKSIGDLYCNLTFNESDPSTYWAYNGTYALCPFCPNVNGYDEYCPPTPGPPINCYDCIYYYCNVSSYSYALAFCGN